MNKDKCMDVYDRGDNWHGCDFFNQKENIHFEKELNGCFAEYLYFHHEEK